MSQVTEHAMRRVQNMDPQSMDHLRGHGPWTTSWTQSMDHLYGQGSRLTVAN